MHPCFGKLLLPILDGFAKTDIELHRYHVNIPGSSITPECPYYEITFLTIPSAQQHLFAASTEKYFSSVGTRVFEYVAVAVSIEDAEELVIIAGYRDTEAAIIGDKVRYQL
jgi:hypothetical protein